MLPLLSLLLLSQVPWCLGCVCRHCLTCLCLLNHKMLLNTLKASSFAVLLQGSFWVRNQAKRESSKAKEQASLNNSQQLPMENTSKRKKTTTQNHPVPKRKAEEHDITKRSNVWSAKRPPKTGLLIEKARTVLGYEPHSFDEGIAIVADQIKN